MPNKKCKLLIFFVIFLCCQIIFAQESKQFPLSPRITNKSSCEMNTALLSNLMQNTAKDDFIIVISHLGELEKQKLMQRRLNNINVFFSKSSTDSRYNRSQDSFLVAEGKKEKSKGSLDFYVKGELELRIVFDKNQDLYTTPCVFALEEKPCSTVYEKLLYPCKSKSNL